MPFGLALGAGIELPLPTLPEIVRRQVEQPAAFDGFGAVLLDERPPNRPVGRTFIKQHCTKSVEGGRLLDLTTHYFRKRGQRQFDARTERETEGQFESLVRFEWSLGR